MKLESREKKGTNLRFISAESRYAIYPLLISHEIRRETRVFVDDRVKGEKNRSICEVQRMWKQHPKELEVSDDFGWCTMKRRDACIDSRVKL